MTGILSQVNREDYAIGIHGSPFVIINMLVKVPDYILIDNMNSRMCRSDKQFLECVNNTWWLGKVCPWPVLPGNIHFCSLLLAYQPHPCGAARSERSTKARTLPADMTHST